MHSRSLDTTLLVIQFHHHRKKPDTATGIFDIAAVMSAESIIDVFLNKEYAPAGTDLAEFAEQVAGWSPSLQNGKLHSDRCCMFGPLARNVWLRLPFWHQQTGLGRAGMPKGEAAKQQEMSKHPRQ